MVPQVHAPGAEAEVDFADVWVRLAGEPEGRAFSAHASCPVLLTELLAAPSLLGVR